MKFFHEATVALVVARYLEQNRWFVTHMFLIFVIVWGCFFV